MVGLNRWNCGRLSQFWLNRGCFSVTCGGCQAPTPGSRLHVCCTSCHERSWILPDAASAAIEIILVICACDEPFQFGASLAFQLLPAWPACHVAGPVFRTILTQDFSCSPSSLLLHKQAGEFTLLLSATLSNIWIPLKHWLSSFRAALAPCLWGRNLGISDSFHLTLLGLLRRLHHLSHSASRAFLWNVPLLQCRARCPWGSVGPRGDQVHSGCCSAVRHLFPGLTEGCHLNESLQITGVWLCWSFLLHFCAFQSH